MLCTPLSFILKKFQKQSNESLEKGDNVESCFLQLIATLSVCFSQVGMGALLSWSSPSLIYLKSNESTILITIGEGAWITSSYNIGFIIGYLTIPFLMERIGRKNTLLIFGLLQIVSWLMIVVAKSVTVLCTARIFCGFGYSCIGLISLYIGEIAEPKIRGTLSILMVISGDTGILLVAIMGAYLSYQIMNLILLLIPVLFVISFAFMPESPYFYVMKGRDDEAVKSLMRLRGIKSADGVMTEIEQIKSIVSEKDLDRELRRKTEKLLAIFSDNNRRGLIIVVLLHVVTIFSGSLAMIAYAHQIFEDSGFELTPSYCYVILGIVKIISGLMASQLIEVVGRKVLYLTSGIFSSVSLIIVGLFFFLKLKYAIVVSINWLPLVCLVVFEIASSTGIGPLPFVLGGEVFTLRLKNISTAFVFVMSAIASLVVDLIFPVLNELAGVYVSFFFFGIICFFGTSFIFTIMPETKGKSLGEIQLMLNSRNKKS